jgi:predicted nucleic acid-binding protein
LPFHFVVDANILFSALLAKGTTRALIFNQELDLYAPEYLLSELNEHLRSDEEIKEKLRQTGEETTVVVHALLHRIKIIPLTEYSSFVKRAIEVSPDEYDAPYFAVSLHLRIPLWSNEKRLKNQKTVRVLTTKEIIDRLG